jgi:cellulose synthase/poly-beta-1,6-N-acetylglucosamine synthase-like glycosyltransferase
MSLIIGLYWLLILVLVYAFGGYLLVLLLYKPLNLKYDANYRPNVSLIISVYNEAAVIERKILNTLELNYPKNQLQIIIADDGSNDKTVDITSKYQTVDLHRMVRQGKTACQNESFKVATGEIIVFSDANAMYGKNAIINLVRNFADERVGCVCGELTYTSNKTIEGTYWSYEKLLKRLEGRSGRLLGANGSIYAIRKTDYIPLPSDAISDFTEPILIYGKGKDVVYEPNAIASESAPKETTARKRRIILRSLNSLKYLTHLMNIFHKRSIFFPLLSHKLLHWMLPIILGMLFILNLNLVNNGVIYQVTMVFQILFYFSGVFLGSVKYFIQVNFAALLALLDWIRGKKIITWTVLR